MQQLHEGQQVRIKSGALEGLTGRVGTPVSATRSWLWLDGLPTGVRLEIDDAVLEPLEPVAATIGRSGKIENG